MKINNDVLDFIKEEKIDVGFPFDLKKIEWFPDRIEKIESIVFDKKVVHLGCCDHLQSIDFKIKHNKLLHSRLSKISQCIGVDIDEVAIDYLKKKGISNILLHDITSTDIPKILHENKWDFLVAGEIIEHIANPLSFLKSIHNNYKNIIDRIIITVPNAFCSSNFKFALKNRYEGINSTHYHWFSPYTIAKTVYHAGFQLEDIYMVNEHRNKGIYKIISKIFPKTASGLGPLFSPLIANGIFVIAKF